MTRRASFHWPWVSGRRWHGQRRTRGPPGIEMSLVTKSIPEALALHITPRCSQGPWELRLGPLWPGASDPEPSPRPWARTSSTNAPASTGHRPTATIDRFNHTMLEERAYIRPYHSEAERVAALPNRLHPYNHTEPTALKRSDTGKPRYQPLGPIQLVARWIPYLRVSILVGSALAI